jgi:dTDP-4-amino-4,6-dideoxygalactose transaminase
MMTLECKTCHLQEQEIQPQADCRSCHGQIGGFHKNEAHSGSGCTACHPPHTWKVEKRETCLTCHPDMKDHNAPEICWKCHPFTGEQKTKAAAAPGRKRGKTE